MAEELKARLTVDTSGFKSGMADAASAAEDSGERMRRAQAAYNEEAAKGEKASRALGAAFDAASANGADFVESMEQAVSAVRRLQQAEDRETNSLRSNFMLRRQAVEEIGVFQGSVGGASRAIADFASRLPGVQGAISLAFSGFAIAGMIELAVDAGNALYKAFDIGGERARETQNDIRGVDNELNHSITSLQVQTDKLQQEQAKLEHKPFNGLKLALDEAAESAQTLEDRLDAVITKEAKIVGKDLAPSLPQTLLQGKVGTKPEQTMLEEHQKWLGLTINQQQELNESISFGNALQEHMNELKQLQTEADQRSNAAVSAGAYMARVDYSQRIAATQELIDYQKKLEQPYIQANIDNSKQFAATQHARDVHGNQALDDKAARAKFEAMETERAKEEEQGKLGAQADIDFWEPRIKQFGEKSNEYRAILDKVIHDREALARSSAESNAEDAKGKEIDARNAQALALANVQLDLASGKITKLEADQRAAGIEAEAYTAKLKALRLELEATNHDKTLPPEQRQNKAKSIENEIADTQGQQAAVAIKAEAEAAKDQQEEVDKAAAAQARLNEVTTRGKEITAQNTEQLQLARIAMLEADGAITPLAAAMDRAATHAELEKVKIQLLREELENLQEAAKKLRQDTPEFKINLSQQAQVQNQISQTQGQAGASAMGDAKAIQNAIQKPYLTAFNAIETGWQKVQRDMILGTGNIQRDFAQMGANLVVQMAANWEKMLAQQIATEIKMSAAHKAALLAKQADNTTAAAVSNATTEQSALKEIFIDAKTAAAGAYKAMAGIPVVGPELGAIAAGVTFAAVMALASFDTGTSYVPRTGVAMIHQGEAILPPPQTQQLAAVLHAVDGSGGGRSNVTHNNVRTTLNQNIAGSRMSPRDITAATMDGVRRGHIKLGR